MTDNGKQRIFNSNVTQFRQGNPLTEVCEFDDHTFDSAKQKEEIFVRGFRNYPDYSEFDKANSPFQHILVSDTDALRNDMFFSKRKVVEDNKFLIEEGREVQPPVVQSAPEKKKGKAVRKKDLEKNSQIIDPSREPNYIGNLPLDEIMKNFESAETIQKPKKTTKKKNGNRKTKEERVIVEDDETDVPIVLDNEEATENDLSALSQNGCLIDDKVNRTIIYKEYLTETNNNNTDMALICKEMKLTNGDDVVANVVVEKPRKEEKKQDDQKMLEKKSNSTENKGWDTVEKKKKALMCKAATTTTAATTTVLQGTVFTIKNPFFGQTADKLKRMSATERNNLWTQPIELLQDDKTGKLLSTSNPSHSLTATELTTAIETRKKLLKLSHNASSVDDVEFLKSYIAHKRNNGIESNNKRNESASSQPERSKFSQQQQQRSNQQQLGQQQSKKVNRKVSSTTYPVRGG